ncbi:hypothetical protein [Micromonospora mirobrigensis]|uniref:Uncharacterized protein n=1 Tax=Micromonospora mirobrigensis TaxID=262898 RepID=A0A1C4WRS8_9ACTN|nr:hypothetical protein [Micromonospora mirobrigensis]SCE98858.1 hypothetical protein GA0070564_102461 [Micromonospora mirobrigensis]
MDFVDSVLVRLGDPATRSGVLDDAALANLVAAAYDTEAMPVGPPYSAVFDELTVGYATPPVTVVEGEWMGAAGQDRTELRLRLHGLGPAPLRVDALWRGGLVVRTSTARDRVQALAVQLPSFDVDPEIVADLGALPTDPAVLETERRSRLVDRLRSGLDQPAAFTDAHVDRLLRSVGAGSVSELVTRVRGQAGTATVQLRYAPPAATPPTPRVLPLAAAVFVRGAGFSLADLLLSSRLARSRAEELGLEVPAADDVRRRRAVVVVWIVPAATFDDPAWPGGTTGTPQQQRADRYARAGRWLAAEGIGLVAVP